jgi:hypothetical protein
MRREWQARRRRAKVIAPLARPWFGSFARFAWLPFALSVSPAGSCTLAFSITSGRCHLKRDLPLAARGKRRSSPWSQSPELGDTNILITLRSFSVQPN